MLDMGGLDYGSPEPPPLWFQALTVLAVALLALGLFWVPSNVP